MCTTRVVVFVADGKVHRVIAEDDIDVVVLYSDLDQDVDMTSAIRIDNDVYSTARYVVNGTQDATECAVLHDAVTEHVSNLLQRIPV